MKKRNLLLLSFPLLLGIVLASAWGILHWQEESFEQTYLDELHHEAKKRLDVLIPFFQPLLEKNDLDTLDRYCQTYQLDQRSIAIFDIHGAVIAASGNADLSKPLEKPDVIAALQNGQNITTYHHLETDEWMSCASAVLTVGNRKQIVRIVEPNLKMASTVEKTEWSIFYFLAMLPILAFLVWYLLRQVASPLDRLQQSVEKIAAGQLDVPVEVPAKGAVRELALSVADMAERLKKEVETVRRQEKFRRDFVSNVSHEIKTPLTGILSAIQMLDDGGWNNPVYLSKCRDVLARQIQRLQTLVRDVLRLAELDRIEESEHEFELIALDEVVRTSIRICSDTTAGLASKASIRLSQCDAVTVKGDARLLEQAFLNLLTNAVRYGGESEIDVSLVRAPALGILTVRDYGQGIPAEWHERIFERFSRLPREYRHCPEGTGLGLAIVKQIATIHHATISLKECDGPGACFVFSIPLIREESDAGKSIDKKTDPAR